eukprot:SAG31_NODE_22987_length_513_cov_3.398551_2_plen_61_part_00
MDTLDDDEEDQPIVTLEDNYKLPLETLEYDEEDQSMSTLPLQVYIQQEGLVQQQIGQLQA